MAYTTSDVAMLEAAIASGAMRVTYADRTVTYQSLDAMRRARREMLGEISAAAGNSKRRTYRVTQTGAGL